MLDWETAIEGQGDALKRILVALAAIAWLMAMNGARLPRGVQRAVLRPLKAAQQAAGALEAPEFTSLREPASAAPAGLPHDAAAAQLIGRFVALVRVLGGLIAGLAEVAPRPEAEAASDARKAGAARSAIKTPDTS